MKSKSNRKTIVGALGLPIKKDGKVLITRRYSPQKKSWHNKWQVAGGEIEFGETPEQALSREMYEELGVSARIIFPLPIVKTIVYKKGSHIDLPQDVHIMILCYLIDIGDQKISLEYDPEKETSAYKWIHPQQIHKLDSLPLTKEMIEEAEKICNQYSLWNMLQ